jgi:Acetyl esterase (deacetylase)
MRKITLLMTAVVFATAIMAGCGKQPAPDPVVDPVVDPAELEDFKLSVPVPENNWIYSGKPTFVIHAENPNKVAVKAEAKVRISKDTGDEVTTFTREVEVPASGSLDIDMAVPQELEPGFYKAGCYVKGRSARIFGFGVSPEKLVSAPDKQADFDTFWEDAKKQLAAIDMKANLIEITGKSSAKCKVYLVELQSVPDGLEGDPVTVRGYYLEPQDGQPHPVLMHFYGYDTIGNYVSCPGANNGDYAEFYLSHRGQYINRAPANKRGDGLDMDFTNTYGDWFAFQFGDKNGYYYRGAFMDCVQAVRFMATRPTSDMNNLFGEGSSQGGALSYAAAALSDYPFTAIAPCVAFLGDYPDYFRIVSWPASTAKTAWKKYTETHSGLTEADMYTFLSYFDTKNLATRIQCAVIACSGLQDTTCPPHTNTAPFNNLTVTDKVMYYYPELGHQIPSNWPGLYTKFFKERIK